VYVTDLPVVDRDVKKQSSNVKVINNYISGGRNDKKDDGHNNRRSFYENFGVGLSLFEYGNKFDGKEVDLSECFNENENDWENCGKKNRKEHELSENDSRGKEEEEKIKKLVKEDELSSHTNSPSTETTGMGINNNTSDFIRVEILNLEKGEKRKGKLKTIPFKIMISDQDVLNGVEEKMVEFKEDEEDNFEKRIQDLIDKKQQQETGELNDMGKEKENHLKDGRVYWGSTYMRVIGITTRWKEKGNFVTLMGINMKEVLKTIKEMGGGL
jgi:hypothetical protein